MPSPLQVTDVNAQSRIEPGISSRVDVDITAQQQFLTFRDVILLSPMDDGVPATVAPYISLREIQADFDPLNLHISGVNLASYIKVPSFEQNIRGAYRIFVARVGIPTQATYILRDGAAASVATLTSRIWGTGGNQQSVIVGTGSVLGKRVTLQFDGAPPQVLDNLQPGIHLAYTGNGTTATLTILRAGDIATRLQTTLAGSTDGSVNLDIDLTSSSFPTVQSLVNYLNVQNGYRAALDGYVDALLPPTELDSVSGLSIRTIPALLIRYIGTGSAATMTVTNTALTTNVTGAAADNLNIDFTSPATTTLGQVVQFIAAQTTKYTCTLGPNADINARVLNTLTNVATQDIKTAIFTLTAQAGMQDFVTSAALGSIIYAVNNRSQRFVATRTAGAVNVPANIGQTYLAGGTNPATVLQDWTNALDRVDSLDLTGGLVFPNTTDRTVLASVLAWMAGQHTDKGKAFRGFFGAIPSLSIADIKAQATGYGSTVACFTPNRHLGDDGLTQLSPVYGAAIACGLAAGVPLGKTNTNVRVRSAALVDNYTTAQREDMENNGVYLYKDVRGVGVVTAFALTTSLSPNRIDRVLSESMARDVIDQNVRADLDIFIGEWGTRDLVPRVKGRVLSTLDRLETTGVITKGTDANGKILPAYTSPLVSLQAGVLTVEWTAFIGGEISHIDVLGHIGYQTFLVQIALG